MGIGDKMKDAAGDAVDKAKEMMDKADDEQSGPESKLDQGKVSENADEEDLPKFDR